MIPTRLEVITFAQMLCGDPAGVMFVDNAAPSGGQINIGLLFESAYRKLWTTYDTLQIPQAQLTFWYNLPANTTQLSPSQAGLTNFTEPVDVDDRDIGSTVAVLTCTTASPIQVTTTTPHNISAGTEIVVSGVGGQIGANGRWFPTIVDASNFTLNGSSSVAAFTSGGTVTTSTDFYTPVKAVEQIPPRTIDGRLREYVWQNGTFYFFGSNAARQLRITFFASGAAPATGPVGIDDSKEFLSYQTAASACEVVNNPKAAQLTAQANSFLDMLTTQDVRVMQRSPVRHRAYRAGGGYPYQNWNPSGVILP